MGAGPSGLFLAHALQEKLTHTKVTVIERRESIEPELGAGLNLNGAVAVADKIKLKDVITNVGNPLRGVRAYAARNGRITQQLFEVDVATAFRSSELGAELMLDGGTKPAAYTVMRSDALKGLADALPSQVELKLGTKIQSIKRVGDGVSATLTNVDNGIDETREFDLVVGCDGVRSTVRRLAFGDGADAQYAGLRVLFAVAPAGSRDLTDIGGESGIAQQFFAEGAYALSYTGGIGEGARDLLALVYRSDAEAATAVEDDENVDWREGSSGALQKRLIAMCKKAGMPQNEVVALAEKSTRLTDVGVYHHLPRWQPWYAMDGRVVLLGDAVHAMPPFLGQGANQAMQDCYCLATLLGDALENGTEIASTLAEYQRRRFAPTAKVAVTARVLGELETAPEGVPAAVRDVLFRVLGALDVTAKVYVDGAAVRV